MDAKLLTIILSLFIIAYIVRSYKNTKGQTIFALVVAFSWVFFSGFYTYTGTNYMLLGLNLFAFIAWTAAFTGFKEIYDHMSSPNKYAIISGAWILFIIAIEWIGYNTFQIQLDSTYSGLFGLQLLHLPPIGQIYYLTAVPIFIKVCDALRIK